MAGKPFTPFAAKVTQTVFDVVRLQLENAATEVAIAAQQSITAGSVGGEKHVPSKPGEPPNNKSGQLASTIVVEPLKPGSNEVRIIAPAPYAEYLEYGTSRIAARPFMRPALAKTEPLVRKKIAEAVAIGIKKGS